jgi:crotonobetainyl-CoA:carnitine CoA-transferase CaiB-like acyl-CoA transferase
VDALTGVRVVDLASVVAGPGTARHLADFGADVIKVEPPAGDPSRKLGWTGPGEDDSYFWKLLGRGKRVVELDLKEPGDLERMRRLLRTSDVLIENMRPGKLEKLGLVPDRLLEENPRLVILRVSGFGQDGPYASRPGFATLAEALSGLSALTGEPDGPPLLPPVALTDEVTAIVGAFAVMLALRHAERSGEGQVVDVSLLESMFQLMGPLPSAYAHLGYLQPRLGAGIPYTVPRGTYRCADGVWVAISSSAESVARRVLTLLGLDHDPRFATFQDRFRHREALEDAVGAWVSARPSEEVLRTFEAVDAAIAPVYTMADIFADPHFAARQAVIEVDGIRMQNVIARLGLTPGRVRHAGRAVDADGPALRAELDGAGGGDDGVPGTDRGAVAPDG